MPSGLTRYVKLFCLLVGINADLLLAVLLHSEKIVRLFIADTFNQKDFLEIPHLELALIMCFFRILLIALCLHASQISPLDYKAIEHVITEIVFVLPFSYPCSMALETEYVAIIQTILFATGILYAKFWWFKNEEIKNRLLEAIY